jgi:serine O-acetyltransferase
MTAPTGSESDVSATTPDWSRERCRQFWDPGRRLLRTIRKYQRWKARGRLMRLLARYWVLEYRFWSAVSGAEIPLNVDLGGGLLIPHPNGVVIHSRAVVGPNCLLFQQVTLGGGPKPGFPVLGGHVDVGAGAKLLGGIRVGDHAKIGANAVVLDDVPAGATAVGVPAHILLPPVSDGKPAAPSPLAEASAAIPPAPVTHASAEDSRH